MKKKGFTGATGLPLSRHAASTLKSVGILAHPFVSLEHQELAGRYVLRGLESGGAIRDMGRYITFADVTGEPLEYLQPVEAIGANGLHAVVVAPELMRVDVTRKGKTYELLVTRHRLRTVDGSVRPQVDTEVVFRGYHGRVELDLPGKDKDKAGSVVPTFLSLGGEPLGLPDEVVKLVKAATRGAACVGCTHAHYLAKPKATTGATAKDAKVTVGTGQGGRAGHVVGEERLTGKSNGQGVIHDAAALSSQ
jgi:hypothetical protein